jgi:hypothetical protein
MNNHDIEQRVQDERRREHAEEVRKAQIDEERRQREQVDDGFEPHEIL